MSDTSDLLNQLAKNRFDPATESKMVLPDDSGLYLVCLKESAVLPGLFDRAEFTRFTGARVLYTGIAGTANSERRSLRERDYGDHFERNNAGRSTLRKSLGVVFEYRLVPRDNDPSTGKTKFTDRDEAELTVWMKYYLFLFYTRHSRPWEFEDELIERFNPPLNLRGNRNPVNAKFRKEVSRLRNPR